MSQGFVKLNREKGIELLEGDPQAFLLLSQIALRARRADAEYSRNSLKANQAFLGDYKKAGLSRQQYRDAQKRLTKYGLATFERSNKGTIATLTSIEAYDINAEQNIPFTKPPDYPMKIQDNEPTKNQPISMKEPIDIQQKAIEEPVTRKEECKKATTPMQHADTALYECLQNNQQLSLEDKQSLMIYTENRVLKAIEWVPHVKIKKTLIQALHWHCKQEMPPLVPEKTLSAQTPQQNAAWEYNEFLKKHGYATLATKNQEAIPKGHSHLILDGQQTTVSLNNSTDTVQLDFRSSENEILNRIP